MRRTIALAAVIAGGLLTAGAGAASADQAVIPVALRSWNNGQCVGSATDPVAGETSRRVTAVPCTVAGLDYWAEVNAPLPAGAGYTWALPAVPPAWAGARGPVNVVNGQTGWCLDSNDAGDVYSLPCQAGNQWQQWDVFTVSEAPDWWRGVFVYRNRVTGRALQVNADGSVRTEPLDVQNHSALADFNHDV